jgi:hypothetical protein
MYVKKQCDVISARGVAVDARFASQMSLRACAPESAPQTTHGHEAVLQSPWVTTCVCVREKWENGAKLTGQKWPKRVGHDGGGDWIRSAHQPGTRKIQLIGSEYLQIRIITFPVTYTQIHCRICLLNVKNPFLVHNTILTGSDTLYISTELFVW